MNARLFPASVAVLLMLSGCADSPAPTPEPSTEAPGILPSNDPACFTGDPWSLDLADYARQSETYLFRQGIPITDVDMTGSQTLAFSEEGLLVLETDITTTGVLLEPEVGDVPISVHSGVGGSGKWAVEEAGTLLIDNWETVDTTVKTDPADPAADVTIPVIDFATIASVDYTCAPGLLSLVSDELPVAPLFTR